MADKKLKKNLRLLSKKKKTSLRPDAPEPADKKTSHSVKSEAKKVAKKAEKNPAKEALEKVKAAKKAEKKETKQAKKEFKYFELFERVHLKGILSNTNSTQSFVTSETQDVNMGVFWDEKRSN